MYCNYKLSKYQSKNKTNIHKIKYNYYKNMVGGFESVPFQYVEILNSFINDHNERAEKYNSTLTADQKDEKKKIIDPSHGLEHALMVLCHAEKALEAYKKTGTISEQEELNVKLAAFLHDIDDHKYFPESSDYSNARYILGTGGLDEENINQVIQMISWVSSSKNGDRIPEEVSSSRKYYLLYPRYADRLEALGIIGLKRTLDYTETQGAPLYYRQDPKPGFTIQQIYEQIATPERYICYSGASRSMMDHFYDKLLLLGKYPISISNEYFDKQCKLRQKPLEDIAVKFEQQGFITKEEVEQYIKENQHISATCSCNSEVVQFITEKNLH